MILSALQVCFSSYVGISDADSLIQKYDDIKKCGSEGKCYKGKLEGLVSEENDKIQRWIDYIGFKNWILAFIRLFVLNVVVGLFLSVLFSKNYYTKLQSGKIYKLRVATIIIVFFFTFFLLGLGFNTDINGSVFKTRPKIYSEILLILISLFTAIVSAYFSSVGDILGHNFLPRFVLRNNVKKSDTEKINNQNNNKNYLKLSSFANLSENKWVQVVAIIVIFVISIVIMYFSLKSHELATKIELSPIWAAFIEVALNFLVTVFVIVIILIAQIYNHRYHLFNENKLFRRKMNKSIWTYVIIIIAFAVLYTIIGVTKYEADDDFNFIFAPFLLFCSVGVGSIALSFLDSKIRERKSLQYALEANALPISAIGRFKTYLVELIDVSIDPTLQDLLNFAVESSETKVNYDVVYLSLNSQKFIAIEIVTYLENHFISQEKFNTGKFIAEYNALIQDIDSAMQQFLINDDNTLKAIASAHRLKVLTKELKELLDFI
ncbi:hypothetical protein [Lysinibacillus xylanilyticus]|uniref:hypothetical protein n=1 Tax=Lysinibacillus xylanilyticus TaxID=582475 RepID=UPI003D98A487